MKVLFSGEQTRKKFDPRVIANNMPNEKWAGTQDFRFDASELLTWQQVSSYWSAYSRKIKNGDIVPEDEATFENENIASVATTLYADDANLDTKDSEILEATTTVIEKINS